MLTPEQKRDFDTVKTEECAYCKHSRGCRLYKAMNVEYGGGTSFWNIELALQLFDGAHCKQYENRKGDVKKWS